MEIAGALAAGRFLSGALGELEKRVSGVISGGEQSAESTAASEGLLSESERLREILSQYDLSRITPRELSEMLQQMRRAGVLSDQEYQRLSLIRLDLDLEQVDPNQPVDLVAFYADRLARLRKDLDDEGRREEVDEALTAVAERLGWLEKFAAVQEAGPDAGLDAVV
jgi:hypothetical protein